MASGMPLAVSQSIRPWSDSFMTASSLTDAGLACRA
jgi:hypothetical protein